MSIENLGLGLAGCFVIVTLVWWAVDWIITLATIQRPRLREYIFTIAGFFTAVVIFGLVLFGRSL